jgi:hypothetical protein
MQRINGRVIIDISEDEYMSLMLALGYAIGARHRDEGRLPKGWLLLSNAINAWNPHFIPYEVNQ